MTTTLPANKQLKPKPCSALALDVGRRRIGLAGCDPLGLTVTPMHALSRGHFPADLERLTALVMHRRVEALVVGLPLDSRGNPTEQSLHCRRYGERLALSLNLPIAWVNEHASTWAAGEQSGLHGDRSGALDSAAAALLLEQWLADGPPVQSLGRDHDTTDPVQSAAPNDCTTARLDPS